MVKAFKYEGRDLLDDFLGRLMVDALTACAWAGGVDAVVCVPSHWSHRVRVPLYAPKLLARIVSRRAGIPRVTVLRRTAGGPHQMDVPRSARPANIRGKFAMIPGTRLAGATLCVLDDVSTTGATLNECAKVLKRAGAKAVYGLVFAKVDVRTNLNPGV